MSFRELYCQRADSPGCTEHQYGFAFAHLQRIVDALQRGQPRDGRGTGLKKIEPPRHNPGLAFVDRDVLGIEAALRILRVVGVDPIPRTKAPDARACRHDDASAVGAESEWKLR